MTAWRRGGRTVASPSRLACAAPPLRAARRGARKRSWLNLRGTAPFATKARLPWRRDRPIRPDGVYAILVQCPGAASHFATAASDELPT